MSFKINFGAWGAVFAVPTAVVDKGLKLASEAQVKVLLYILRNSGNTLTDESVAQALSIHPDDVRDSITYWADKGLLVYTSEAVTMPESFDAETDTVSAQPSEVPQKADTTDNRPISDKPRPVSRATKPEPGYVAKRLRADKNLVFLMDEAQRILGKVLSNSDTATLVMLHDTDGLPVEVILMLMEHCVQIDKGNMRYIEKTGIQWASDGVTTISLAEEKIKRYSESSVAWNTVSAVFGMRLSGTPTKKQLEFSNQWVNIWKFTEDMLRLAYERCVDSKGELSLSYVNGILRRWYEQGFRNADEVMNADKAKSASKKKQESTSGSETASYDIDAYEKKSIFDD